jgi:hypothetical protein
MLTPPFVSLSLRQDFPEARAALVAALWADGLEVQAETEWQRVNDPRYADKRWLREVLQPRSNSRSPIVTPYLKLFRNSDLIEISISEYGSASSINFPIQLGLQLGSRG